MLRQRGNFRISGKEAGRPGRLPQVLVVLTLAAALLGAGAGMALAVPATVLWEDYPNLGLGQDFQATGVAVSGSKIFVPICGLWDLDQKWNGELMVYDASKGLSWYTQRFDLQGGRTRAIAVSGSTVMIIGHYFSPGSGTEQVFVRAYGSTAKKGMLWERSWDAPYAGLYPLGIAALGSKVVVFWNTGSQAPLGQLMGISPKTGDITWGSQRFGENSDVSSQVNAIAVSGSSFFAVGFREFEGYKNWWAASYSASNGGLIGQGGDHGDGYDNELLAVSWSGNVIGVAGYESTEAIHKVAYAGCLDWKKNKWTDLEYFDLGYGENRFNAVAVTKSRIYVAGYGSASPTEQAFMLRSYDPKTGNLVDSTLRELSNAGGMVTTGIAAGKSGIYVAGSGLESPGVTYWFVWGFNTNLSERWLQDFSYNGGNFAQANGVAVSSSAVVAVGTAQNGPGGSMEAVIQAYAP